MTAEMLFSFIGQIVLAGGGGALIALSFFQFFGKSWIQNQLAKDLEIAKSEISLLAARRLKLHDREHEVFPEVWARLNEAFRSLGEAIIALKDAAEITENDLTRLVEERKISDQQKQYILSAADHTQAYRRILDFHSLSTAKEKFHEFERYFRSNRIFISPEIKGKLDQISEILLAAWVDRHMNWQGYRPDEGKSFLLEAWEKYDKKARPIMIEIEGLLQEQLFPTKSAS
jgi:hypothetical protein